MSWKDVIGWENIYEVSDSGMIRRVDTGIVLSLKPHKNGYVYANLSFNGIKQHFRVHRLVAISFIPNPDKKEYVNHVNGIKHDNRVENLEWTTPSENDLHAYKNGLRVSPKVWSGKYGKHHNRSLKVRMISDNEVKIFDSIQEAERLTNVGHQNIIKVCKNQRKTAGGFKWEYVL